jgi:hypothetical protein
MGEALGIDIKDVSPDVWLANCYFAHDSLGFPCPATILRSAIRPFFSLLGTLARLLGLGSARSIILASLPKDQLVKLNHFRQRCRKARPDTPISMYYSNRLCFIG